MTPSPAGRIWVGVGVAAVAGFALRAAFVGDQSLGYEEAFSVSVIAHATASGVWQGLRATESTPPLYYVLTWLWVTTSGVHSAVALRMVSLIAGSATVPAAFLATRRFVGNRLAVVVAWLCAINPLLVEYSIYARSYALFVLMLTVSLWAFGALLERPSWRRWLLWAAAATACMWTHYFAGFMIAGELVVLFAMLREDRRRLLASTAVVAVAFAPLWSLFRAQQSAGSSRLAFITAQPLRTRLEDLVRQVSMGTNVPHAWLEGSGIAILGLALAMAALKTRRETSTRVLASVGVIAIGVPLVAAVTGAGDYILARNVIGASICLAPPLAYGLTRWRGVPLAAYSVLAVLALVSGQTNWRYQGSTDWAGANQRIHAAAAGDPIAVMPSTDLIVAELYLDRPALAAPIRATDLWVIIEPTRGAHHRALTAVRDPPLTQLFGPHLEPVDEIDYQGFRMIQLHASSPQLITTAPRRFNGRLTAPLALLLAPQTRGSAAPRDIRLPAIAIVTRWLKATSAP